MRGFNALSRFVLFLAVCQFGLPVQAKEVKLLHNGLTLNANLELADGKALADGVVLITHSGLAHGRMGTVSYLQQLLKDSGYSSLAITLSLGINDRHGMLDCHSIHRHRFADGGAEIGVWIDWLKGQRVNQIALIGHSRGASQTALYMAEKDDARIMAIVLLAPDTRATNDAAAYQRMHGKPLAPVLQRAQDLVATGKGSALMEHTGILFCRDTTVSADTIVSYYGPDPRLDTPFSISRIRKPLLIILAGADEVVIGSRESFMPIANGKQVQVKVVDNAGHFFRDLYSDDAVDMARDFFQSVGFQ